MGKINIDATIPDEEGEELWNEQVYLQNKNK